MLKGVVDISSVLNFKCVPIPEYNEGSKPVYSDWDQPRAPPYDISFLVEAPSVVLLAPGEHMWRVRRLLSCARAFEE